MKDQITGIRIAWFGWGGLYLCNLLVSTAQQTDKLHAGYMSRREAQRGIARLLGFSGSLPMTAKEGNRVIRARCL